MAPRARFELATLRLTAECSTIELPGNRTAIFHDSSILRRRLLRSQPQFDLGPVVPNLSKPRRTFSTHSRRYSTSSFNCSAYLSVMSLLACPIQSFSKSHGTRKIASVGTYGNAKGVKPFDTFVLLSESRMILLWSGGDHCPIEKGSQSARPP